MVREDEVKDHDEMVRDFCAMSGAPAELATQYLESNDWDMLSACNSFFHDEDERNDERRRQQAADGTLEQYSGPRTLDGRPAPQEDFSSAASRKSNQQKKKGIATLGSLGSSAAHHDDDDEDDDYDDDEDDDGRGNLFAGGEKSGLAVQDPKQEGGSRKIISDILAKAKANSRQSDANPDAGPSRQTHFRGTGVTLGGDGVESRSIPDPRGLERPAGPPVERVLHIWQDGFSIDDGELRRFDDPSNEADLQLIRSGRAPLHLMNVQHDQSVDVKLHQHDTPYKQPPKKYKPFAGSGHRLGSPVPGATATTSATASSAPSGASSSSSAAPAPSVDNSQPTIMIRIQMPDGSRLPARFNTTHTVGDIYGFVEGASVDTRTRPWVLVTTFPNKEHSDKSLVLGEMTEFKKGGTAVVKWA
ncbi:sep domain-containing [Trichoderma arundinaceum]|uniref:Sep domain-containing n=1 Tax=Trichoderma arundinaceum TaxID=490622 RepID=A0A395NUX8_TRIAR|nr:sep domain-containing [Trichoderma arundinaceum]